VRGEARRRELHDDAGNRQREAEDRRHDLAEAAERVAGLVDVLIENRADERRNRHVAVRVLGLRRDVEPERDDEDEACDAEDRDDGDRPRRAGQCGAAERDQQAERAPGERGATRGRRGARGERIACAAGLGDGTAVRIA